MPGSLEPILTLLATGKIYQRLLASVECKTIRLWEHRMIRWAKDAQMNVKKFSSHVYTSHRRVPETLACQFDA
jgi:hypothetical protein